VHGHGVAVVDQHLDLALPPVTPPAIGALPLWARVLIARANRRTPHPGFTGDDLMATWERCEGRCAVSGMAFSEAVVGTGRAQRPYAPSLDRIDRSRGYEPDNVRLVSAVANFAMNAWGLEPVLAMARAMAGKYAEEVADADDRSWLARQDARIIEAERQAAALGGNALAQARRRIAALKRARTLGPAGLRAAAEGGRHEGCGHGRRGRGGLAVGCPPEDAQSPRMRDGIRCSPTAVPCPRSTTSLSTTT
jgi:hypothetical protein